MRLSNNNVAPRVLACLLLGLAVVAAAPAQEEFNLHPSIRERVYKDDKISVQVPASWQISILRRESVLFPMGAELRKGNYVLRLCTACGQTSGVMGGRFAEISYFVQPWARTVEPSGPCGNDQRTQVTGKIERVDYWFRRDANHVFNEETDLCRAPKTTDTVWYGSYFAERCSQAELEANIECGGFFLHGAWLTRKPADVSDEMTFALTYDTSDLDRLPRRNDEELQRILAEAAAIVRSIRFYPPIHPKNP